MKKWIRTEGLGTGSVVLTIDGKRPRARITSDVREGLDEVTFAMEAGCLAVRSERGPILYNDEKRATGKEFEVAGTLFDDSTRIMLELCQGTILVARLQHKERPWVDHQGILVTRYNKRMQATPRYDVPGV